MKILRVALGNLASFEEEVEVDLRGATLDAAGIFAITGPTGAGKSTLLDAICLALFGQTPRLGGGRGLELSDCGDRGGGGLSVADPRNLLRRGAGQGFAEVDFRGKDGQSYRARWQVQRSRGKVGRRLQGVRQSLVQLDERGEVRGDGEDFGRSLGEVRQAVEARLGLNFKQFVRSVMLAQGDFAAFLREDRQGRAELLQRITGTDLYDRITTLAFAELDRQRDASRDLELRQEALQVWSDEERQAQVGLCAEQQARLELKRGRLAVLQQLAELAAGEEQLRQDLAARHAERDLAASELAKVQGAEREAEERVQQCRRQRRALLAAAATTLAAALSSRQAEMAREQADRERRPARIRLAGAWDIRVRSDLESARDQAAAGRTQAEDLPDLDRRRVEAQAGVDAATQALAAARDSRAAAEVAAALVTPDVAATETWAEDHRMRQQRREVLARVEAALRGFEQAGQQSAALAEGGVGEEEEAAALRHEAAQLRPACERWAEELAEVEQRRESLRQQEAQVELRAALCPGSPCPVCGALEHPHGQRSAAQLVEELAVLEKGIQELKQRHRVAAGRLVEISTRQQILASQAAVRQRQLEAAEQAAAGAEQRLSGVLGEAGIDPGASARASLAQAIRDLQRADGEADRAQREMLARQHEFAAVAKEQRDAIQAQQAAEARLGQARDQLRDAEQVLAARRGAVEASQQRVQELRTELRPYLDHRSTWEQEFETDPAALLSVLAAEVAEVAAQDRRFAGLADQVADLQVQLREVEVQQAAEPAPVQEEPLEPTEWLVACADPGDRSLRAAALEQLQKNIAAARVGAVEARQRGDTCRQAQAQATGAAEVLVSQQRSLTARREALAAAHPAPGEDEQVVLQAAVDSEQRRHDRLRAQLDEDQRRRELRVELGVQLQAALEQRELWLQLCRTLGNKSGNDSFNVFAQQFTFRRVLAHANHRLRELAPRYRLEEVPEHPLELQVIDQDMGDELRPVRSLSGGESFLVSLSLALGLASISSQQLRIETMFIDEGFGTLDQGTLDQALAALESLRAQGRQIGLISHVPGLAERLGAEVRIRKLGGGRSALEIYSGA